MGRTVGSAVVTGARLVVAGEVVGVGVTGCVDGTGEVGVGTVVVATGDVSNAAVVTISVGDSDGVWIKSDVSSEEARTVGVGNSVESIGAVVNTDVSSVDVTDFELNTGVEDGTSIDC